MKRFRKHRLRAFLSLCLALTLMLSSITVYAGTKIDENAAGSDNKSTTVSGKGGVKGGASYQATGICVYILDSDTGEPLTKKAQILYPGDTTITPDGAYPDNFQTRIGEYDISKPRGVSDMPYLVSWNGNSFVAEYSRFWKWLSQSSGGYDHNYLRIADSCFQTEYRKALAEKKSVSIVIEPVAWHKAFKNGSATSGGNVSFINTAAGWAKYKIDNKLSSTYTDKLDMDALAHVMTLDHWQFGWSVEWGVKTRTSNLVSNKDICANAYGVNIINVSQDAPYTTATSTPGEAPKVEGGTKTIIKCYESRDLEQEEALQSETPIYKPFKTFIQTSAPSKVSIESEPDFIVTDWQTQKDKINSVSETDVYENLIKTAVQQGNGDADVEMSDNENTLVIRLRDDANIVPIPVELEVTGDKEITQSKITQSASDVSPSSLTFSWNSANGRGKKFTKTVGYTKDDGTKGSKTVTCCYATKDKIDDANFVMKMLNGSIDTSILCSLNSFPMYYSTVNTTRDSASSKSRYLNNARYTYDLHRLGDDKLSLCGYAKDVAGYSDNASDIKSLVGRSGSVPSSTRKISDYSKGLSYTL